MLVHLKWVAASHPGNRRSLNEDSVCLASPLFMVADGMGGHHGGDVASLLAVGSMSALASTEAIDADALRHTVEETSRLIHARSGGGERSMGTTITGMAVVAGRVPMMAVVNVGDSRSYCWCEGELRQLTVDHSHVQELVDRGLITTDEAKHHPERNVVTRALGIEPEVEVDLTLHPIFGGQRWLACSDGLSGELDSEQLGAIVSLQDPEEAVTALLASVLAGPARDNVSMVLLDVTSIEVAAEGATDPRWGVDNTQPIEGARTDLASGLIDDVPVGTEWILGDEVEGVTAAVLIDSVPSPWPPPVEPSESPAEEPA